MVANEGSKKEAMQIVEEVEQVVKEARNYLTSKGIKYESDHWLKPGQLRAGPFGSKGFTYFWA